MLMWPVESFGGFGGASCSVPGLQAFVAPGDDEAQQVCTELGRRRVYGAIAMAVPAVIFLIVDLPTRRWERHEDRRRADGAAARQRRGLD